MAHNVSLKDTTANAMLDAITTAIGASGLLRIYDGTQPATADTALSSNNVLAGLTLSATFAPASSAGLLTANAIGADASADLTGTASFFSLLTSGGTRILDGTVGVGSTFDLNISTVSIVQTANVSVSSLTIAIN
jgi:hypothetical protein